MDVQRYLQSIEEIGENVEMLVFFNSTDVLSVKEKEVQTWKNNDVYEEVENVGQDNTVRWVVTEKLKEGEVVI